jgi:hypothetical protein
MARVFESAHRCAAELPPAELASELQTVLGQKLVAFALGDRHPKTVGRYARDDRRPDNVGLSVHRGFESLPLR